MSSQNYSNDSEDASVEQSKHHQSSDQSQRENEQSEVISQDQLSFFDKLVPIEQLPPVRTNPFACFMFNKQSSAIQQPLSKKDQYDEQEGQNEQNDEVRENNEQLQESEQGSKLSSAKKNKRLSYKPYKIDFLEEDLQKPIDYMEMKKLEASRLIRKKENRKKQNLMEKRLKEYKFSKKKDQLSNQVFNAIEEYFYDD